MSLNVHVYRAFLSFETPPYPRSSWPLMSAASIAGFVYVNISNCINMFPVQPQPAKLLWSPLCIILTFFAFILAQDQQQQQTQQSAQQCAVNLYKIQGNIYSLQHDDLLSLRMSLMNTKILVNHGQYVTYPKDDGSFEVDNLPSDSYVVEVVHPKFIYEPSRVDITTKGKIRARRVNYMQPALVQTLDYPLQFRPKSLHNYFIPRETWRIMDLLLNPMVVMMVAPLAIIWLLPKLMSPQEVAAPQRESVQMPEYNVPELSEMMANMFGRGQPTSGTQQPGSGGGGAAITSGGGGGTTGSSGGRRAKRR